MPTVRRHAESASETLAREFRDASDCVGVIERITDSLTVIRDPDGVLLVSMLSHFQVLQRYFSRND